MIEIGWSKVPETVTCAHCGSSVQWSDSALAPEGYWCEICFRVMAELYWLTRTPIQMPGPFMRYGAAMEVWPWWEA